MSPALREIHSPHSLEAERALLGSVILDNEALHIAAETLAANDFFSESSRITFTHMMALSAAGRMIDVVTLADELAKEDSLEKIGGASYLAALTDGVPVGNYSAVREYARIVKEKSNLRRMINSSYNVIARCSEGIDDPDLLAQLALTEFLEILSE